MPSDKILFPRRMLYVEAVLYLTVAASAFGLGYLAGRRGPATAGTEDPGVLQRVPVEGKVLLDRGAGKKKQADAGAVVIVLPAGKPPTRRLPIAGLRPGDPPPIASDATASTLAEFGGVTARADASGNFTLFVPAAGSYRILVLSRQATREANGLLERSDITELGTYFDAPAELLQRSSYRWLTRDIRLGADPINVEFGE